MTKQPGRKFQTSDVLRMFPTFVWKPELRPEVYNPINDSILRSLGEFGTPLANLTSGHPCTTAVIGRQGPPPSRRSRQGRYAVAVPRLAAALGGSQPQRSRAHQHWIQHHVPRVCRGYGSAVVDARKAFIDLIRSGAVGPTKSTKGF